MQEFKKAVRNLVFTKTLQLTRVQPNEHYLHDMVIRITKYLLKKKHGKWEISLLGKL